MVDIREATDIIDRYTALPGGLLECLHGLQGVYGYVPKDTIDLMADGFNLSRAEVHGVISYYHDFKTSPQGRKIVRICLAEACQSMGSRDLSARVEELLGIKVGQTSENGDVSLEAVYCFGNCALSPNIEVDGKLHARVDKDNFENLMSGEIS
ncbi:MAG: NAD(P)H-dependent oxidoreductase subunit E [Emcibacteraceae bacterium]|nr:NAD(P)H-dependent oxidoreductase subunit E [Emcibacteraceae bacterium]MDG1996046.1 NAD(P)H-dependent oxidoreductase subunit E [Emcibacteraceae bacterium]